MCRFRRVPGMSEQGHQDGRRDGHRATIVPRTPTSWLELFYDLVLVAATIVLTNAYGRDVSWSNAGWLAGMFSVLWWVWFSTTELTNRDRTDTLSRRLLLLGQMFAITIFSVVGASAVRTHDALAGQIAGVLLFTVAAMAEHVRRTVPELSRMATQRRNAFCLGAALAVVGGSLPDIYEYIAWFAAAVVLVAPVLAPRFDDPASHSRADVGHLVERFGLITIIVLGESFVKVAITASDFGVSGINFLVLALEFLTIFAIWVAYFDDVALMGLPDGPVERRVWYLAHIPLHLAIVAMAVGLAHWETLKLSSHLSGLEIRLFVVPLAMVYITLGIIGIVTPRPGRLAIVAVRWVTAALVVVVGVLAWNFPAISVEIASGLNALAVVGCALATEFVRVRWNGSRLESSATG